MKKILKGIYSNPFDKAKIKLTFFYVLIMTLIIVFFSSVLFLSLEKNMKDTIEEIEVNQLVKDSLYNKQTDNLQNIIIILDSFLLILISLSSYYLAHRTLKPIKNSLESQKKFTADASHDLRTPLAIMRTENEVLIQNPDSDIIDYKQVIKSNLEEISKMSNLVEDLLLIARTENISGISNLEKIDLKSLLSALVTKNLKQIESKNIKLEIQNEIAIDLNIYKYNFERAVQNILQNAINYTKENGSISIKTKLISKGIEIAIKDTGVGISEKDLPNIYDRFYKAEHSRNDNSGSGLGLGIAKQIIEQNGGNITLSSEMGVGTKVTITL